MGKFLEIDAQLMRNVVAAVEGCWNEGSPVVDYARESWQQVAHVAIRRIRSLDRRNVSDTDHAAQLRDIAKGLIATFEKDPKLVGQLIVDYEYVAERALDAYRRNETGPT